MLCPDSLNRGRFLMLGQFHRHCLFAAAVLVALAGQVACAQGQIQQVDPSGVNSRVAAVVDGRIISTNEVEKIALRRYGQEVLNSLIDNILIERKAEQLHVKVSEVEIDNQVQMLAEAIKPKTLEEGLKEHHQTIAELRDDFRHRLLALKVAAMSAPRGHFVHAHVIFVKFGSDHPTGLGNSNAFERANAIQKQLLDGASFKDLAEKYSQDSVSRARGGDVGILFEGCGYSPAVVEAVMALKAGKIAGKPIRTPSGYYIVMVSSTDSEHPANEDKLYSDAETHYELYQGSRQLPEYLRELRAKATIKKFLKP